MAKPCIICEGAIKSVGVKNVYWTTEDKAHGWAKKEG